MEIKRHHDRVVDWGGAPELDAKDVEVLLSQGDVNAVRLHHRPPPEAPVSWGRKLWHIARNTVALTLASTSLLGAFGYVQNYDALNAPVFGAPTLTNVPPAPAEPARPTTQAAVPTIVPQATAQQLFGKLQESPQVQAVLAAQMAQVRAQVQDQLQHLPPIQQTDLLDVHAPLPTGDGNLLGPLPSFGIHELQSEVVPITAVTNAHIGALQANIRMDPVQVAVPQDGPPGGVYLGSFHTQIMATSPSVAVSGDVRVGLDLDGRDTRAQLADQQARLAQATPGSDEAKALQGNIDRLNVRLAQGQHLAQAAQKNGFAHDMDRAMADQGYSFKLDLPLSQTVPLVDGYDHLWLVPGDKGGPPQIVVTDQLSTPSLDNITVPAPKLSALPHHNEDGLVLGALRSRVSGLVQKQVAATFGEAARSIPASAADTVRQQFGDTRASLQTTINGQIDHYFQELIRLQVTVTPTLVSVPAQPPPVAVSHIAFGEPPGASQLRELFVAAQKMPAFQKALNARVEVARAQVQQQLDHLPPVNQKDLVDVQVKLPADLGDGTLSAPLVINESGQVSPIKVRLDVAPVTVKDAPRMLGMVYLGSYRTTVYAASPAAQVQARAGVSLDDGQATRDALKAAQQEARGVDPNSARGRALQTNIQHLQARSSASESLNRMGVTQPLTDALGSQGVTASLTVPLPQQTPLMVGMTHVFVQADGPGGVPKVVVTDDLSTPGIDGLKLGDVKIQALPGQNPLQALVAGRIQEAATGLVGHASDELPDQVRTQAQVAWRQAVAAIQTETNAAIQHLVQENVAPVDLGTVAPPISHTASVPLPRPAPPQGSMAVVLSQPTMARIMTQVQNSPQLQQELRTATAEVQAQLASPQTQDGEVLLYVKAPGGIDLPMRLTHHLQVGAIPARVQITPEILTKPPPGPAGAVYLGSFKSDVWATKSTMQAGGTVQVALDTDGRGTEAELKVLRANPQANAAEIQKLEHRLAWIDQWQSLKLPPDAQKAMDALTHQQVKVQTTVNLPTDRPLVSGMDHIWLTASGLQITGDVQTPGAAGVALSNTTLSVVPHEVPPGFEGFQKLILEKLQAQGDQAVGQVAAQIPSRMAALAQGSFDKTTATLQTRVDQEVRDFYAQHQNVQIPLGDGSVASPLSVGLVRLTPTPDGQVAAILQTHGGHQVFDLSQARPGQGIESLISTDSINTLLQDKSQGGNVDWTGILKTMAKSSNIDSLQFNHDAQGHLMTPHLVMRNGQVRAEFDMTATVGGLRPVGLVTGALNGATAPLRHAGPLSFLHAITGGVKEVMDHTVGAVVDAVPDLATRPVVSLHVSVPLQFDTSGGALTIRPDTRGLQVTSGQSQGHFLLPTQLPGSAIAQGMVSQKGPAMMAPQMSKVAVPVDLRAYGVDLTSVAPAANGQLQINAQLGTNFSIDRLQTLH